MNKDRLVTVCASCFCAGCWHGELMCGDAIVAGTVEMPRSKLGALKHEHPSNFSDKRLLEVCGGPAGTKPARRLRERA